MQKRFLDGIYRKPPKTPEPPKPKITPEIKPVLVPKKIRIGKRRRWLWILGVFLFLIMLFLVLFWQTLLGPQMALAKIASGLNGRYLILFQNNTELRPAGGFIGSFAEAEIKNGQIKNWYFDANIYKRDKEFTKKKCIPSPAPAQKIWGAGCMNMANANWSPDFQASMQDVAWYYQQENGNPVAGVIAVDTTFFTDLLRVIGPIQMSKYGLTVTPENFTNEVQYEVEKNYWSDQENWQINEPKTILKEMVPEVMARLKNWRLWPEILKTVMKNIKEKHILFSFENPDLQDVVLKNNWGGKVKETENDYLYINDANLGGLKSSQSVKETVDLKSKIQDDGSILNTLKLTRVHQGNGVWPDAVNKNYTRILVPKGSILIAKNNIDSIDSQEELGKSEFGFWTTVSPGETKIFEITYKLPLKIESKYSLLIQKQPGASAITFHFSFQNDALWRWDGEINEDKSIIVNLTE